MRAAVADGCRAQLAQRAERRSHLGRLSGSACEVEMLLKK